MLKFFQLLNASGASGISVLSVYENHRFLLLHGEPWESLQFYAPPSTRLTEPQTEPHKKLKRTNDSSDSQQTPNPYFVRLNDACYARCEIKFDMAYLRHFDFASIDHVLVSELEDLLPLALLLAAHKLDLTRVKVLLTEPVRMLGKHYLQEVRNAISLRNKGVRREELQPLFFEELDFLQLFESKYSIDLSQWQSVFEQTVIDELFGGAAPTTTTTITTTVKQERTQDYSQLLHSLNFAQSLRLTPQITIEALSSGISLGSCYWRLQLAEQALSLAVLARIGSGQPKRYVSPLDTLRLQQCDVHLYTQTLPQIQQSAPFVQKLSNWLRQRVNVLVPLTSALRVLDFIDLLMQVTDYRHAYIFAESVQPLLHIADCYVEYLNPALARKLTCVRGFQDFSDRCKTLSLHQQISNETPSVYFVVDPALRLGTAARLIEMFEESAAHTQAVSSAIIRTDQANALREQNRVENSTVIDQVVKPYLECYRTTSETCVLDVRASCEEIVQLYAQNATDRAVKIAKKSQNCRKILLPFEMRDFLQQSSSSAHLQIVHYTPDDKLVQISLEDLAIARQGVAVNSQYIDAHTVGGESGSVQIAQVSFEMPSRNSSNASIQWLDSLPQAAPGERRRTSYRLKRKGESEGEFWQLATLELEKLGFVKQADTASTSQTISYKYFVATQQGAPANLKKQVLIGYNVATREFEMYENIQQQAQSIRKKFLQAIGIVWLVQ